MLCRTLPTTVPASWNNVSVIAPWVACAVELGTRERSGNASNNPNPGENSVRDR